MYYTNITNPELEYFKEYLYASNFTIKLSDILHQTNGEYDNKLFKIEDITDNIYRIIPLFNTRKITSTNPEDKIFEDKLILTKTRVEETFYTFINNPNEEIKEYTSYGEYYSIGDQLTTAEFNSIITLLRRNIKHQDTFTLNNTITGKYGTYEFDLEDVTFLDTGMIVSNQTILAEPKVKLTGNVFKNSTYTLKLDVIHYTGVNILDDVTPSDFKVVDTIEVELIPNTWVDIPVDELEEGYIISLNAIVEIAHDKPVISADGVKVFTLTSNKSSIAIGETCTLTAYIEDYSGEPISDETITFKIGSTTLDTVTTGSDGTAEYIYTGTGAGSVTFTVEADNLTREISILDGEAPVPTSMTVSSSKDILSYYDSESATLTALVKDQNGSVMSGQTVVFKKGSSTVATETTDSSGVASYTYSATGAGDVGFTVECSNLQETYSLEDCIFYHPDAISYTGTSTNDTVYSLGYDQIADLSSTNFEMTWKFRQTNYGCDVCLGASSEFSISPIKSNYRVYIGNSGSGYTRHGYRTTSTTNTGGSTSGEVSLNTDHAMKIVREGNTFSYYFNDVLMGTKTVSFWTSYNMFGVHTVQWNKGTTTVSEIKIKPL